MVYFFAVGFTKGTQAYLDLADELIARLEK